LGYDDIGCLYGVVTYFNLFNIKMDKMELQVLIAGAVIPFLISLLKRWVKLTKQQLFLLVFGVSFLVASIFELIECSFSYEQYLARIATVYGTSQTIYWLVLKSTELDLRIENK
jgi:hypothetical protein